MSGYIGTQPVPQATQTRDAFTATAGQTSFATGGYTPQFLDVYLNGVHLQNGTDYTAANGSDVVLTTGAALDDVLEVVAYTTFDSANTYNRTEADAEFVSDPNDVITVSGSNVGIGTSSPSQRLSLGKSVAYSSDSALYVDMGINDAAVNNNAVYSWRTGLTGNDTGHSYTFSTLARSQGSYVERMRINSAGVITTPNQPLCSMNNGAGWLTMVANTVYGVGASYAANRGGFYAGASLGGYPVTHVPATGLYRVTLHAYVTANQSGRLSLRANQSTLLCFLQIPSIPSHTALTENIVYLNAYDYLDYVTDATMQLYHADLHTYVTLEFLG
jgi:hypothetical protein